MRELFCGLLLLMLVGCGGGSSEPTTKILAIGQSNMEGYGNGLAYTSTRTFLEVEEGFVAYESTNEFSSFLPILGDGLGGRVEITNEAVGATSIEFWSEFEFGGEYDYVLFQQGESDTVESTSYDEYRDGLQEMLDNIRDAGIDAPIFVANVSYHLGEISEDVRQAQRDVVLMNDDVYLGPNTDVLGEEYRHDNVHFNKAGLMLLAETWLNVLEEGR